MHEYACLPFTGAPNHCFNPLIITLPSLNVQLPLSLALKLAMVSTRKSSRSPSRSSSASSVSSSAPSPKTLKTAPLPPSHAAFLYLRIEPVQLLNDLYAYLCSSNSRELVFTAAFTIFAIKLFDYMPLTYRPVPYQLLEDKHNKYIIRDPSLNLPYKHHRDVTISDITLGIIGIAAPLTFFVVATSCIFPRRHPQEHKCHNALSAYLVGVSVSEGTTNFLKRYVGRLRPNFYGMCDWDDSLLACTETNLAVIEQSRKSFPSGHSSLSFCAMFLVSSYLFREVVLARHCRMKKLKASFLRFSFSLLGALVLPMCVAIFVAASRSVDNWHHTSDIVAGAMLGLMSGHVGWSIFNPPVSAELECVLRGQEGDSRRRLTEMTPLL